MSPETRMEIRRSVLAGGAAVLLAVGAGAGYVVFAAMHPSPVSSTASVPAVPRASGGGAPATTAAITIPMSAEARARAGIELVAAVTGDETTTMRAPAVVEPNAYRRVVVTALAAGRVTRLTKELGAHVAKGDVIAEVFSPELAEAQAAYVSARAELEAHDRELARMEKLVTLGSASRQELERVVAEHASRRTGVQSAAARLRLLGVSDEAVEHLGAGHAAPAATLQVRAPLSGVVTERPANVGVNVDPSMPLATIVDLSIVWVVADLYEADFSRVRVGTPATVTTAGYPGVALFGRVSYIDPQVSADSRTAKARIEVPNPRQELRLGMLAQVSFGNAAVGPSMPTIPRAALQTIGDRTVVYVAHPADDGEFAERTVRLGEASGERVTVVAGLAVGEQVVGKGSFSVRAERERLGLGEPAPTPPSPVASSASGQAARTTADKRGPQAAKVTVTKDGFVPAKVTFKAGSPARLTFLRTTDETCAKEIAVPSLKFKRPLPLNVPVDIDFTPPKGTIEFVCGMNMLKGAIVVD